MTMDEKMIEVVKTTVLLKTPEEVLQLLEANPEIEVKLSDKAAQAVSMKCKDIIEKTVSKSLSEIIGAVGKREPDALFYWFEKEDGELKVELSDKALKAFSNQIKEKILDQIKDDIYGKMEDIYTKACQEAKECLIKDYSSLVADIAKGFGYEAQKAMEKAAIAAIAGSRASEKGKSK